MAFDPMNPFGTFSMRASIVWRYRLFGIILGGFGALMALLSVQDYWLTSSDTLTFVVLIGYAVLAFLLIPYAVYAIEKSLGFLMGGNMLVFEGHIFILLKLVKYALAGFFLPILAPIGLIYVRNENMFALGQMEAQEMMAQHEELERQAAAEAAEVARKEEIREEAKKLMQEMKEAEKE
ncbi:hypothetical protein [Thalassovita mediterranea]|uniref:Uncharacterized protein n=1 Tax=Thalassovita mediterranea TaxID=340021 RepID=A0A0P1GQV9_9RHOB|nr:hypothetical protein [Thalassovita mediterranea]CUH84807.1 hypothetical protein TM5383_02025 [Thalassovita mediterranea]SIS29310.1 hypothetical protein SAMN05421685_101895 [Thalassovita mediterranea]